MGELGEGEAGDAAGKQLLDRGGGSFDPEGTLELDERGVVEVRRVRAPGVSEDAADDPVGASDESVESGVVGVDEQVGEPAVVAAEGECVSVEEDEIIGVILDQVVLEELGADPYTIEPFASSTLTWKVKVPDRADVSLSPREIPVEPIGSMVVSPQFTENYSLKATAGTRSKTLGPITSRSTSPNASPKTPRYCHNSSSRSLSKR